MHKLQPLVRALLSLRETAELMFYHRPNTVIKNLDM